MGSVGGFGAGVGAGAPATWPRTNSAPHPSITQTPLSSYPHVFPSRHAALPVDVSSATPAAVTAAQCVRSPGFDAHDTEAKGVCGALPADASDPASCATAGAASERHNASVQPASNISLDMRTSGRGTRRAPREGERKNGQAPAEPAPPQSESGIRT